MASKHPLRRSCAFCRARKIKCSNETICEACRRQGADCIYDFESPRPKARSASQDSSRSDAAALRGDFTTVPGGGSHRHRSSTAGSPNGSPRGAMIEDPIPVEEGDNVARALEQKFYENFSTDSGPRSSPWQERISSYNRSAQNSVRERSEGLAAKFAPRNVKYNGILSLLTHDLVGLVADQFGSLGCQHVEDGGARFFLSAMVNDETQTMFDNIPLGGNPLAEYGQRQQTQLIDVWFSVHPLSFLVSKTLLLREMRDGTHDEILLATMLADANFSIGDEVAMARGHVLLRWATAQLRSRPLRPNPQSHGGGGSAADASARMCSGISTRIFSGISTAQALMLLAWNALCSFQLRRATCYIGLSGRIATEIKEQISSTSGPLTSSRINGIDVFDVEKEIVAYLYWTTYSLSLWAFIQMGNGHFSALLPTSLTSIFLPVTEASSVIIQLDMVSENFSTLQKQKSVIREMWPLAHISSVIAYIYALYPSDTDPLDAPAANTYWQEAPLLALQRLQQGKPTHDMAAVCREIHRVLMESIHILNRQVTEVSSRSLVLAVYHAMAIHFLFPAAGPSPAGGDEGLSAETLERLCSSTQEILHIFQSIADQPQDLFSATPTLRSSFPDVFCLALDTCARALSQFHARRRIGALLMDAPMVVAYEGRLEVLSAKLYEMSQHDFLAQGKSLRVIRKHLKACLRGFGHWTGPGSASSVASSPDHVRSGATSMPPTPPTKLSSTSTPSASSTAGSEHLSQATTAIDHPSARGYFVPHVDSSSTLPSSDAASSTGAHHFNSPAEDLLAKSDWSADDMFHAVLDPSVLDGPAAGDHLSVSDLVDMQNAWYPHMQSAMDLDMTDSMAPAQWDWNDVGADTTASGWYYFDASGDHLNHHNHPDIHQHSKS